MTGQRRGCKPEKKSRKMSKELDLFVTVMLVEETLAVLSLGKLCEDHGYTYHWTSGQKTTSHKKWQENWLQHVKLFVIRRLWFIDELSRYTKNPVLEWSGSTSEELRGNQLHKLTKTENKNKHEGREEVQSDLLYELAGTDHRSSEKICSMKVVLQSHGEILAPKNQDTSSSSHELPLESASKSGTWLG